MILQRGSKRWQSNQNCDLNRSRFSNVRAGRTSCGTQIPLFDCLRWASFCNRRSGRYRISQKDSLYAHDRQVLENSRGYDHCQVHIFLINLLKLIRKSMKSKILSVRPPGHFLSDYNLVIAFSENFNQNWHQRFTAVNHHRFQIQPDINCRFMTSRIKN